MNSLRDQLIEMMRAYYDAGHIVDLNADVMAHKIADRIEAHWDQFGRQKNVAMDDWDDWDDEPDSGSPYCECGNSPIEEELASNRCSACGKALT